MQVPTSQLASLERLEELKLGNNYFVSLPSRAFRGLRKLRSLDLSDSPKLRSVSSSALADNDNLASLSLSGCRELQPDSIQVKIFQLVGKYFDAENISARSAAVSLPADQPPPGRPGLEDSGQRPRPVGQPPGQRFSFRASAGSLWNKRAENVENICSLIAHVCCRWLS